MGDSAGFFDNIKLFFGPQNSPTTEIVQCAQAVVQLKASC